jgi:hypothetical protein
MNVIYRPSMSDYQRAQIGLGERRLDLTQARDTSTRGIAQQRLGLEGKRVSLAQWKAEHPNMTFKEDREGKIIGFNPQTGGSIDTGRTVFNEEDELELRQQQALERQFTQGDINTQRDRQRQIDALARIKAGGEEQRTTRLAPQWQGEKPLLPTQEKVAAYNRATELRNKYPNLAPFIKLGEGNEFDIVPPATEGPGWMGGWGGTQGPTQSQYDALTAAIYGPSAPRNPTGPTTTTPVTPTTPTSSAQSGRIRVMSPDGKLKGTVPAGSPLPEGWKRY